LEKKNQQNPQYPYIEEDEIDLYELFLTLKKRWEIIVSTAFFLIIIAVVYILISKPVYKHTAILKISDNKIEKPILPPDAIENIIQSLNDYIKYKRYGEMSSILDLQENILKNIQQIQANKFRNEDDILKIEIYAYNYKDFNTIENSLINYLNNKTIIKDKINAQKIF
jgi:capsular polysaccharide biosynthesis protein